MMYVCDNYIKLMQNSRMSFSHRTKIFDTKATASTIFTSSRLFNVATKISFITELSVGVSNVFIYVWTVRKGLSIRINKATAKHSVLSKLFTD